jgi:hypothetical protein
MVIIIKMKMGHECKKGLPQITGRGATVKRVYREVKEFEVYYIYMDEDSIMKSAKYCLKKG